MLMSWRYYVWLEWAVIYTGTLEKEVNLMHLGAQVQINTRLINESINVNCTKDHCIVMNKVVLSYCLPRSCGQS